MTLHLKTSSAKHYKPVHTYIFLMTISHYMTTLCEKAGMFNLYTIVYYFSYLSQMLETFLIKDQSFFSKSLAKEGIKVLFILNIYVYYKHQRNMTDMEYITILHQKFTEPLIGHGKIKIAPCFKSCAQDDLMITRK